MNFDKPLFKIYHIETLMRTTIKALEAAMLDIAKATNRFTLDLMKDLTNEIDIYWNLESEKLPVFKVEFRVDKDFYVPVWQIMSEFIGRTPKSKNTKYFMTLSLGQVADEHGFSEKKAISERGLMIKKII